MSLTVDFAAAVEGLSQIAARTANMTPFMTILGEYESDQAKVRIATLKTTPEFSPWAPWSLRTLYERMAKGNEELGLLYDTGALLESIHSVPRIDGFEVGTGLDYGRELQEGRPGMPPRPFLGWSPEEADMAEKLALLFIEKGYLI